MHSKQESLLGGDFSTEFRFLQALTKGVAIPAGAVYSVTTCID